MASSQPPTLLSGPRAWRFGLTLVGLAALLAVIAYLGHEAWVDEPNDFDHAVHAWVVRHRVEWPGLTRFFRVATRLGNPEGAVPATVVVALGLYALARRGVAGLRKTDPLFWLAVILAGRFLCVGLKLVFLRDRPPLENRLVSETEYSFPSGHSVFAAVFSTLLAGFLVRILPATRPWLRLAAIVACLASAVVVAVSRVWLGAHYPTDVIGGLLLGAGWAFAAWMARLEWTVEREAEVEEKGDSG